MTNKYNSVFDIPVKSVDGEENFLDKFRGKVLMFINTTGHCGNAPQWPTVEKIRKEIGTEKFDVIYVPTNDYCGSVTYGEFVHGLQSGKDSERYAKETYGVDSNFTELLSSRNTFWEEKNLKWSNEIMDWDRNTNTEMFDPNLQKPRSELYDFLLGGKEADDLVEGNFHKIITNAEGKPVASFHNGTLLPYAKENGAKFVLSPEEEEANMKAVIKNVIKTGKCHLERYEIPE